MLLILLAVPRAFSTFEVDTLSTSGDFYCHSASLTGTSSPLAAVATGCSTIGRVNLSTGVGTLLAGVPYSQGFQDGAGADARFGQDLYPAVVGERIVVTDAANFAIRLVDLASGDTSTLAGNGDSGVLDGAGGVAQFCDPKHAAHVPFTDYVLIADGRRIRKIDAVTGEVSTAAGLVQLTCAATPSSSAFDSSIQSLAINADGLTAIVATSRSFFRVSVATGRITRIMYTGTLYNFFTSLVVLPAASGSRVMVADRINHCLWTFEQQDGASTTSCVAAGSIGNLGSSDGQGTAARFNSPAFLALMAGGTTVVVRQNDGEIKLVNTAMESTMCEVCSCVSSCMPPIPGVPAPAARTPTSIPSPIRRQDRKFSRETAA